MNVRRAICDMRSVGGRPLMHVTRSLLQRQINDLGMCGRKDLWLILYIECNLLFQEEMPLVDSLLFLGHI